MEIVANGYSHALMEPLGECLQAAVASTHSMLDREMTNLYNVGLNFLYLCTSHVADRMVCGKDNARYRTKMY